MIPQFALILAAAVLQGPVDAREANASCLRCHTVSGPDAVAQLGTHPAAVGSPEDVHHDLACTDCHIDTLASPTDRGMAVTPVEPANALEAGAMTLRGSVGLATLRACEECHPEQYIDWERGGHAAVLAAYGVDDPERGPAPPLCTDCHGAHGMRAMSDPESPTAKYNVPDTCGVCHADEHKTTYDASVHGQKRSLTGLKNEMRVAVCSSCHGNHEIHGADHPDSRVSPANRPATCGECHPGAATKFSEAFTHQDPTEDPLLNLVHILHVAVTGVIAACMFLFMGSEAVRVVRALIRGRSPVHADALKAAEEPGGDYQRWSLAVRLQHIGMVVSFTTLSITGIPLMFPEAVSSRIIIAALGGVYTAGLIHRIAAVGLMIDVGAHLLWVAYQIVVKKARWSSMLPHPRDVAVAVGLLAYAWGFTKDRPKIGRYGPPEKFEYLAAGGGSVVMTLTGLLLWFPVLGAKIIGGRGIELAQIMHGHEGILAVLVILVIHVCWVHFMPGFWPMSSVWLTGRISREAMEEYHAGERAEIEGRKGAGNVP